MEFLKAIRTTVETDFLSDAEKLVMVFDLGCNLTMLRFNHEKKQMSEALQNSPVL